MNWLKKFFGKNTSNVASMTLTNTGQAVEPNPSIAEELFIDQTAPETEPKAQPADGISILSFLEQDFYGTGYKDGYNFHSVEMMDNRIRSLKASFRLRIDQAIEEKQQKLLHLREHAIDMGGLSERMSLRIEAAEKHLSAMVATYENEKALSVDEEGWTAKPVNEYRDGFLRGAETYNAEKLLAVSTGLFNL
jgi:hypothetical protein